MRETLLMTCLSQLKGGKNLKITFLLQLAAVRPVMWGHNSYFCCK